MILKDFKYTKYLRTLVNLTTAMSQTAKFDFGYIHYTFC